MALFHFPTASRQLRTVFSILRGETKAFGRVRVAVTAADVEGVALPAGQTRSATLTQP
jgi:hypothetical protein